MTTAAWAQAPLFTEREAREAGMTALRELRFDDAIAAYAQSDKAYPGIHFDHSRDDRRSTLLRTAIIGRIQELDTQGAGPEEKLPYWQFYADHYPFFSVRPWADDSAQETEFEGCFIAAAVERCRQADPGGTSPASRVCERVAGLCASGDVDALVACLEGDWPDRHDDLDLCAARMSRVMQERADADRQGTRAWMGRSAGWRAYLDRLRGSAFLGAAASEWGDPWEALEVATDPRAKRRCRLGLLGHLMGRDLAENLVALAAESGPWMTEALGWAWAVSHLAIGQHAGNREEAVAMLARMAERYPGQMELGLARFATYSWVSGDDTEGSNDPTIGQYLKAWEAIDPDDPYLAWARFEDIWTRWYRPPERPLDARDRELLEKQVEKYRTEALGVLAKVVLAEDAICAGNGELALKRFEEVAAFDTGAVRMHGMRNADQAVVRASERLIRYFQIRDVSRTFDLLAVRAGRVGERMPLTYKVECATGGTPPSYEDSLPRYARRWTRPEHVSQALDEFQKAIWEEEPWHMMWAVSHFVEACLRAGATDRIEEVLGRFETSTIEGVAPSVVDDLRQLLADRAMLTREGPSAAVGLLGGSLGEDFDPGRFFLEQGPLRPRGILAILQSMPGVDAALGEHRSHPATAVTVLLASAGETEESIEYLIDVCIGSRPDHPGEIGALAEDALVARRESGARALLRRCARSPADDHSLERADLARFDVVIVQRACLLVRDEEELTLPTWVQEEYLNLGRSNPWFGFALEERR